MSLVISVVREAAGSLGRPVEFRNPTGREVVGTNVPCVSPHLGPLPRERKELADAHGKSSMRMAFAAFRRFAENGADGRAGSRRDLLATNVLPLPMGEGRGEGKRDAQPPSGTNEIRTTRLEHPGGFEPPPHFKPSALPETVTLSNFTMADGLPVQSSRDER